MNQRLGIHPFCSSVLLEMEKKRVETKMVELLLNRFEVFFEVLDVL